MLSATERSAAAVSIAIAWARARGLTLNTFRDVPWNAPFYASMGFQEIACGIEPARLAAILAREANNSFDRGGRCDMRLEFAP